MYPYYSSGAATILDTVLVCTIISVYSPRVPPPLLMYANNSLINNNIVCTMTYTVFIIVIFMYKCVL